MRVLLGVFMFVAIIASGQTSKKLSGKVVDFETREALGYVSVGLKDKSAGTVTNADGLFDFYITSQNEEDTLLISMVGYSQYKAKVKDALRDVNLTIRLKIRPTLLDEVVVSDERLTPREIIKTAFEKIAENCPTDPYLIKAFFREIYQEDNKAVFLVDAVVDIEDDGYIPIVNKPGLAIQERIHPKNIRASAKYFKSVFEIKNFSYLTFCLKWRNIKYRQPDVERAFGPHKRKNCEERHTLDSIVNQDNKSFYVVSYIHTKKGYKEKDTYYIDATTYAIKRHVVSDVANPGEVLSQWRFERKGSYFHQTTKKDVVQEYEYYEGKMYLKYIKGEFFANIYNKKTNIIEHTLKTNVMLLVTDISTKKRVLAQTDLVSPSKNLSEYISTYDPLFWKNYEQAKLFPLTKKQVKDLEREVSLEQQFLNQSIRP